jgi:hypothetical protein
MKFIFSTLFCVILSISVFSQNSLDEPILFHLSLGNSISLGASSTGLDDSLYTEDRNVNPTIVLGADFLFSEKWSAGVQFGINKINLIVNENPDYWVNAQRNIESGDVSRIYTGVRFLRHFGKNESIDWYAGAKLGYVLFSSSNVTVAGNQESLIEKNNNRSRVSLGIIPIGARFFITDYLGGHIQMSIGSPTFFSAGLNYRM